MGSLPPAPHNPCTWSANGRSSFPCGNAHSTISYTQAVLLYSQATPQCSCPPLTVLCPEGKPQPAPSPKFNSSLHISSVGRMIKSFCCTTAVPIISIFLLLVQCPPVIENPAITVSLMREVPILTYPFAGSLLAPVLVVAVLWILYVFPCRHPH